MSEADSWRRFRLLFLFQDIGGAVSIGGLWVFFFGLASAPLFIGLGVVRFIVGQILIARQSAEVERWAEGELGDDELVAYDRQITLLPWRFSTHYLSGWLLTYLLAAPALEFGWVAGAQVGGSEHIMAGLLLLAVLSGSITTYQGRARMALTGLRSVLGGELERRGLVNQRAVTSFVNTTAFNHTAVLLATYFGICAVGGAVATQAWRAQTLSEQQVRVLEFASADPGAQLENTLPEGMAILPEAPAVLAAASDEAQTRAELDLEQGLAIAGLALDDGRWLVAQAEIDGRVWQVLAFTLLSPFFVVFGTWRNSRERSGAIAEQLSEVRNATQRVLEAGELRGIPRFHPPDHDEVGLLVRDFNGLLDVLEELADAAHRVAEGDLRVTIDRPGDLQAAFGGMLAHLRTAVGQIQATAVEVSSAASEIEAAAAAHERVVESQSLGAQRASEAVNALAESADTITGNAATVLANAGETLTMVESGVSQMSELRALTGAISEMLLAVREIADRSDLLALNGSLEAVRAGESGHGFTIVAAEMRRLAERVSGLVEDIGARVVDIAQVGDATVSATEGSRKLAQRTASTAREISTLTSDQGQQVQEVAAAMQQLSTSLSSTAAATAQTRASAHGLLERAGELEQVSRTFVLGEVETELAV